MPKKLQLSIPNPCHENWDAMTTVERGKFCGSCQKQVIDFSNMNDRQVAEFFKKPSTGSVCGRFMTDQLERDIEILRKRIPWLKYFFQFAIPAFLVSIKASAEKTQGQIRVKSVTTDTIKIPVREQLVTMGTPVAIDLCNKPLMGDTIITPVKYPVEIIKGEISIRTNDQRNRKIIGKVTDEKGDALPGVSIMIKGTRTGTLADNNGQFFIRAKTGDILVVTSAGLVPIEVTVNTTNSMEISVKRIIVGIISYRIKPRKEIKNVPLMPDNIDDKHAVVFKIFPNPVPSGSNLNIELKQTEEGYYSLQLLNQSGQSGYQKKIWIDAEARVLNIDIPVITAGNYSISLTSRKSGKRFTEKIILQ